jgi:flagellin FlaB
MRRPLRRLLKQKRGMVGIEAAIVLIAFVIVAAAFSFMVVNMGLFSTQRGRETIQQGVSEASSPLTLDGSIQIQSNGTDPPVIGDVCTVHAFMVPLKTLGVRYVPMSSPESEVTCRIENKVIYADMYEGIKNTGLTGELPADQKFDDLVGNTTAGRAALFIGSSDSDSSLDYDEKGFMVIRLEDVTAAEERDHVFVEIRPEKGAPLTLEFIIPPQLTLGWHTIGS